MSAAAKPAPTLADLAEKFVAATVVEDAADEAVRAAESVAKRAAQKRSRAYVAMEKLAADTMPTVDGEYIYNTGRRREQAIRDAIDAARAAIAKAQGGTK